MTLSIANMQMAAGDALQAKRGEEPHTRRSFNCLLASRRVASIFYAPVQVAREQASLWPTLKIDFDGLNLAMAPEMSVYKQCSTGLRINDGIGLENIL